jgi:hypothetical protein
MNEWSKERHLDQAIRRALRQSEERLPEQVRQRIDKTFASLPERKNRIWAKSVVYAAASILTVFVASLIIGFMSPTMAQVLSRLPFVGSVFEVTGDSGLQVSSREGLATVVNQTVNDQGIEITLNEVIYDGIRLSVGLVHDAEPHLRFMPGFDSLQIDGKPVHFSMGGVTNTISADQTATVLTFTPHEPLPERFHMALKLEAMEITENGERNTIEGDWKFETEVVRLSEGITTYAFDPLLEKTDGRVTMRIREVKFTPITTMVSFEWIEPWEETALPEASLSAVESDQLPPLPEADSNGGETDLEPGALTPPPPPDEILDMNEPEWLTSVNIAYELIDERGLLLEPFSSSSSGNVEEGYIVYRNTALFAPLEEEADYLVFRPVKEVIQLRRTGPGSYVSAQEPRYHEAPLPKKFPFVLSQGDAGTLTIHQIEFADDRTIIHYEVHGKNPYVQDGAFWLEDRYGNTYEFDRYDQERISSDSYAYRAVLPPIPEREGLVVKTTELSAPEPMPDLQITIPLSR